MKVHVLPWKISLTLMILFILVGCVSGNVRKMWVENRDCWMRICDASCVDYRVTCESYINCSVGDTATIGIVVNTGMWNVTCED